jgi:hypothetical protein
MDENKQRTANSTLAIGEVPSPLDSLVVNKTLVLCINPDIYRDAENRHLRQAQKR